LNFIHVNAVTLRLRIFYNMKCAKPLIFLHMRWIFTLLILCISVECLIAQNTTKSDSHNSSPTSVIKIEGSDQNGWVKNDNENISGTNQTTAGNENVSFYGASDGIYFSIINGTNKIKLFALTGQLLFDGELTQGKFLIQTRKGIYFLRINNKSYKVICK